ncbi:protein Kti12p [Diutina catenulata]
MPLITFTGLPSSGKSRYVTDLVAALQAKIAEAKQTGSPGHNMSVVVHSDESLQIDPESYRTSASEKAVRGAQLAAVKRDLSRTTIVVLDSLSYIKGFRYQLYCEAKNGETPHCVVHVVAPVDTCIAWNTRWDPQVIRELAQRYEEPRGDQRWDSPLFSVVAPEGDELPVDEMWSALVLKKPPTPNASTAVKATGSIDFVQELDRQTSMVVTEVLKQKDFGGRVVIGDLKMDLPAQVPSAAQLQRIRRTYVGLNRMRTVDPARITPMFVEYLEKSLNEG